MPVEIAAVVFDRTHTAEKQRSALRGPASVESTDGHAPALNA
jgi:hypothetical protein